MKISVSELLLAYRQAKQALFQEQRTPDRMDIANAEMRLPAHLAKLRRNLVDDRWFDNLQIGVLWLPIKNAVHTKPRESGVIVVDGPAVKTLRRLNLRLHLTPSLDFSTVEAVWLWRFGPALEATLSEAARGNRLSLRENGTEFDLHGRDPFRFWPEAYRQFRDQGLDVAKSMLRGTRGKCIVATFDLASYYDEIDPRFLLRRSFIRDVKLRADSKGIAFDPAEYLIATRSLLSGFRRYRAQRSRLLGVRTQKGIPIGALTARVIANVALAKLDEHVRSQSHVKYYARYVDDILIVASDIVGAADKSQRAIASSFLPVAQSKKEEIVLDSRRLDRLGSKFALQIKKLKVYELTGRRGRDFISTIERDVRLISSERRDLISRDGLESESPLTGLLIGAEERAPVQVLRDVDRLKVERYAANVAINKVDDVTKFISPPGSVEWCRRQLRPLAEAVTDADNWIEFFDSACRALGVSIRARDTETSQSIVQRLYSQLAAVRSPRPGLTLFWNNRRIVGTRARNAMLRWFEVRIRQEFCGSLCGDALKSIRSTAMELRAICGPQFDLDQHGLAAKDVRSGALALHAADLRSLDRESDFRLGRVRVRKTRPRSWQRLDRELLTNDITSARARRISSFLKVCKRLKDPTFRGMTPADMLLMTRPPSTFDIGHRWARANQPTSTLVKAINALRGTRYLPSAIRRVDKSTISLANSGYGWQSPAKLSVVLGSLTGEDAWAWAAADGSPVLSSTRLTSLAKVVNRAIRLNRANGFRNVVLVLPELAVPRTWLRLIAEHLISEDVSLVAGVEYHRSGNVVSNEAVGVFTPGFSLGAVCVWPKGKPARDEERQLINRNVQFRRFPSAPPLAVQTKSGTISTLICSELLEVERRSALMGRIDLLLVPSWNRDTATFDHTIQTTANDVHCYVAIANHATYSDCRIHCPSDERFKRDVCRLICREEDETITAHLDFEPLRDFQRASADPHADPKGFKPVPPGFAYKR